MRTTVDIPDPTYRRLKSKAAQHGCSVKKLILRGVLKELSATVRERGRIQLPIVKSKDPGAMHLTNETIYEVIPFP